MAQVYQVSISGGGPWGFKMQGGKDFHQPLTIGKLTPGGKAQKSGVMEGYLIEKVNGEECQMLTHIEAQNKIKGAGCTLTLQLSKPREKSATGPAPTSKFDAKTSFADTQIYKPKPVETRLDRYNEAKDWQHDGGIQQSPALQKVLTKPVKSPVPNAEKSTLTITPAIKEMILQEEEDKKSEVQRVGVKTWPAHNGNGEANEPMLPSPPKQSDTRLKAAGNISKFIEGSGSSYGEPTFVKALQDIGAPLGEPAVLEVRLGPNLPVPTVHWYHNNRPARESKDKDIRFLSSGQVHTLVLGELIPEVLGTYTCTIMNKHGSKSTRCNVTIKSSASHTQPRQPTTYVPPNPTTQVSPDSKRVIPSTSLGLYSNKNVQQNYDRQVNRTTSRDSNEESEVMKALREDGPPKQHHKTRSMKYLEETLLPESEDL